MKSEGKRQILYDNTLCNLEYNINETETDIKNRLVDTKGRGFGGRDWDFGVSRCRCKLLHIEWINSKVLLHGTGHYIQYPVINHNGKEHKKEYIYIYEKCGKCQSLSKCVPQLCPTLFHLMDWSCQFQSSSVHRILQARILEWIAIPFSRGCSWPRVQTWVSWMTGRSFTFWVTREATEEINTTL